MVCYVGKIKYFFFINVCLFILLSSNLLSCANENPTEVPTETRTDSFDVAHVNSTVEIVTETQENVAEVPETEYIAKEENNSESAEKGSTGEISSSPESTENEVVENVPESTIPAEAVKEPIKVEEIIASEGDKIVKNDVEKNSEDAPSSTTTQKSVEPIKDKSESEPSLIEEPIAPPAPPPPPPPVPQTPEKDSNVAAPTITTEEVQHPEPPVEPVPEEDMQTFDEWKQKMINEKQNKHAQPQDPLVPSENSQKNGNGGSSNGHTYHGSVQTQNFASFDCGAKVLDASPAAQSRDSILNPDRDKYMNIPCDESDKWVIVELCEPIQVKIFEISSFELFSSLIANFTVLASDRYPSREWKVLGNFTAKNERTVQSFQISDHMFTKYLKIDYTGHYGNEHYCPVSLVRVFGISIEVDETEEGMGLDPIGHEGGNGGVRSSTTDESNADNEESNGNVITNTVLKIVNKFSGGGSTTASKSDNKESNNSNDTVADTNSSHTKINPNKDDATDHPRKPVPVNSNQTIPDLNISSSGYPVSPNVTIPSFDLPHGSMYNISNQKNMSSDSCFLPLSVCDEDFNGLLSSNVFYRYMNAFGIFEPSCCASKSTEEPSVLIEETANATKVEQNTVIDSAAVTSTAQKESLIMRLRNKVRELEFNMSLSSEYLEALSKRYKKQMDEITARHNMTLTRLLSTNEEAASRDVKHSQRITELEDILGKLLARIENLELQLVEVNENLITKHIFLMLVEFLVFLVLVFFYLRRLARRAVARGNTAMAELESIAGSEAHSLPATGSESTGSGHKRSVDEWTMESIEDLIVPLASPFRKSHLSSTSAELGRKKKPRNKKKSLESLDLHSFSTSCGYGVGSRPSRSPSSRTTATSCAGKMPTTKALSVI